MEVENGSFQDEFPSDKFPFPFHLAKSSYLTKLYFPDKAENFPYVSPPSVFVQVVVEPTHLKNISQIGSSPQVGMNIKNIWNHHLVVHPHETTNQGELTAHLSGNSIRNLLIPDRWGSRLQPFEMVTFSPSQKPDVYFTYIYHTNSTFHVGK